LKKEIFSTIKKESAYMGILFLIVLVAFKIAFYKESFIVLLRMVFSLFWLFALPGYFVMLYWEEKLGFLERFIIGIGISAAIIGILSYYIGLIGIDVKYHAFILPMLMIAAGFFASANKKE
jgi:hypothetical protein